MRICAVSLPELRVELVREASDHDGAARPGAPLGIVVAPPPLTEAKLLGNTRLDVVSREARALGISPGHTIAQARARAGSLSVRVVRPDAVRDVLARLAEVGLAFGATVAFGMEGDEAGFSGWFGDVVWIDVTGCAHLFGGEAGLAARLAGAFASLGHACAVAIADGPRVAALLARVSGAELAPAPVVVPPGENARALAPLPIAALPLDRADVRWLTKLGVRTIGEVRALPRAGLAARLGARKDKRNGSVWDVLSLVDGDDRAPLTPYVPPEIPAEEVTLEYGVEGTEALTFVVKTLSDRLGARLAGRAVAASRVELELALDAAMLEGGESRDRIAIDLPAPLSAAGDLLAALRPKIERHVLRAPVLGAKLSAAALVHKREASLSLFEPQPKAERALPRLVAELAADLGGDAVGTLVLGDSWIPEDRSKFVGLDAEAQRLARPDPKRRRRHLLSSVPEPTRLFAEPVTVAREDVRIVRHLSRTEAVEWWRRLPDPDARAPRRAVDYVYAWVSDGAAWVEVDRASGAMRVRGWFD